MTVGVYLVAALLLANLVAGLGGRDGGSMLPAAFAQRQPPIAGGGGIFIMPAQLSQSNWGCYLLDIDSGTVCVYQYQPQPALLKLVAARDYKFDRRLRNYNTDPSWEVVKNWVDKQDKGLRGDEPAAGGGGGGGN